MTDHSDQIGQDEIENLLRQAQEAGGANTQDNQVPATDPPAQPVDAAALAQDEIEQLMSQTPARQATASTAPTATGTPTDSAESVVSQNDVELLLNKAEQALASIDQSQSELPAGLQTFEFKDLSGTSANTESATLELMGDIQLDLTIELGRTHMHLEDVLKLQQGAVVPLDKLAGDPADIYVNGRLVARGEVLVLNDNFCVRVAELIVGESACA